MIPGWEGTATSLCVSLSTSSVKLEIKPGLVFFDNSHQKSQTQMLQGAENKTMMTEESWVWTLGNRKDHVLSRGKNPAELWPAVAYGTAYPAR